MKGKTLMFVGDSLGRNQWQSLICMIYTAVPQTQTQLVRGEPLSTFRFLDYGVTISFYRAPYLVEIDVVQGKRILRLEEVDGNGDLWRNADVLSFNTGHWWEHQGSLQGWDYIELGSKYYPDMDRLAALERGMRTWANWVDNNIDRSRTKVFFLGISPSHTNPNEWNSGLTAGLTTKNCYGETAPIMSTGTTYPGVYPEQMRVVDMVIREMRNPAYLLDITMLSAFRKDAHPSIYSGDLNPQQRAKPDYSADCSHWCLPGLPDTWNELFYTALFY
ncbi:protein PMR5-like isoform X3 [Vigna radiata var. radiata]|nr:protein PMR5-like isoform X3 [Vigna radiata var. radiata]